jgi:hypothetical protein
MDMHVAYEGHGLFFIGSNKNRQNISCYIHKPLDLGKRFKVGRLFTKLAIVSPKVSSPCIIKQVRLSKVQHLLPLTCLERLNHLPRIDGHEDHIV